MAFLFGYKAGDYGFRSRSWGAFKFKFIDGVHIYTNTDSGHSLVLDITILYIH